MKMIGKKRKARGTKEKILEDPLDEMLHLLKCSKCNEHPKDKKLWIPQSCAHKYCKSCVSVMSSDDCLVCQIPMSSSESTVDEFSSNLLTELLNFQALLREESEGNDQECSLKETVENVSVFDEEEPPVIIKAAAKREPKAHRSTLSKLFCMSEEDDEIDPDLPALTPHPPEEIAQHLRQNSKKNIQKSPCVLLERMDIAENSDKTERSTPTPHATDKAQKDVVRDELASSLNGSRRSSRQPAAAKVDNKAKFVEPQSPSDKRSTRSQTPQKPPASSKKSLKLSSARVSRQSVGADLDSPAPAVTKKKWERKIKAEAPTEVPSPSKSDIYEFTSQSTKPEPKAKPNQRRRRHRVDSESSTASSIPSSPQLEKQEFIKPAPVRSESRNSVKDVKSSPSVPHVNKRNAKGETPLHIAVRTNKLEKAMELVQAGADVDAKDYAGWTPLHEAICSKAPSLDMVKFLVSSGADVHALGLNNVTPLHESSRLGLKDITEYLLSESASPSLRDSSGKLPKDVAKDEIIRKILDDWENDAANQSQSTDISVQLKISLQKAVFYFAYTPAKDFIQKCRSILELKIATELRKEVTHVVFDAKPQSKVPLSFNYILSVLGGCWLLSNKWLEDSLEVRRFLDPTRFEVAGLQYESIPSSNGSTCDSAIERARTNREHGNPGLFQGINFYIYKNTSWSHNDEDWGTKKKMPAAVAATDGSRSLLTKKDIAKLIAFGDGKVINREPDPEFVDPLEFPERFHAVQAGSSHKLVLTSHIILYDDKNVPPKKYDMEHVKTIKADWLIHSAVHFRLLLPDSYLE